MDVFICWSGWASHVLAEGLRQWLPRVIQAAQPFLSSEDIRKGQRWADEIKGRLEKANFAILCLTPDNLSAPWIHFEAGAVSKNPGVSHVTALLLQVKQTDLVGPLAQFQHTLLTKEEVWKLVQSVNLALEPERQLQVKLLEWTFNREWPDFEKLVQQAQKTLNQARVPAPPQRESRELLEELLTLVRDLRYERLEFSPPGGLESDIPLAMRFGQQAASKGSDNRIVASTGWRLAASIVIGGILGIAGGWFGHSSQVPNLESTSTAFFNIKAASIGSDECTKLRLPPDTRSAVLRVPGLSQDLRVVALDSGMRELPRDQYASRLQPDGSQLLRLDSRLLAGRAVKLVARRTDGAEGEPLGCVTGV